MSLPASVSSSMTVTVQHLLTPVPREQHEITIRGTQKSLSCGVGGLYEASDPSGSQPSSTCGSVVFYDGRAMTMLCPADLEKFNDLKRAMVFTAQYATSRALGERNVERLAITGSEGSSMARLLAPASSPAAYGLGDDLDGIEMERFLPDDDERPDNTARASGKPGDLEEGGDCSTEKKTNIGPDGQR